MHGSRNATTTGAASTRGALRRPTRVLLAFRVWSGVGRRGGEGGLDEWRSGRAGSVVVRVRGFQANRRTTLTMRCAEPALLAWLRGVWSTRSDAASPRRGLLAAPAVPVAVEEEDEAEAEDEAEEADDDDGRGGTSGAPQSSQNAFEWCRFCASTADSLKPFGAAARGGGGGVPNAEPAQLRSLVRCAMVAAVVWPRRQVGACKVPRRESRQARPVLAIPETSSRPPLLVTVSVVRAPTRCAAAQLSVPLRPLAPLSIGPRFQPLWRQSNGPARGAWLARTPDSGAFLCSSASACTRVEPDRAGPYPAGPPAVEPEGSRVSVASLRSTILPRTRAVHTRAPRPDSRFQLIGSEIFVRSRGCLR